MQSNPVTLQPVVIGGGIIRQYLPSLVATFFVVAAGFGGPAMVADSNYYIDMALGHRRTVPAPFSQRVAYPTIAGWLHHAGLPISMSFALLGVLALAVFCVAIRVLLRDLPGIAVIALLVLPFVIDAYRDAYLPDLAFAALLACFLIVLRARLAWWVPLLLVPLVLVRESILAVCVVLAIVAWRRSNRELAGAAAVALIASYGVSTMAGIGGAPSRHNVGGPLYLLGKIPYNGVKNLTGFEFATNDLSECGTVTQFHLPFSIGNIDSVGLCPFNVFFPAWTLSLWLALFGLGPALLLACLRHPRNGGERPIWLQVALWSGLLTYLAAPLLGSSVDRLVAYGWPAFLVVMPLLLFDRSARRDPSLIVGASFALAWVPTVLGWFLSPVTTAVVTVIIAAPAQVLGYRWTCARLATENSAQPAAPADRLTGSDADKSG